MRLRCRKALKCGLLLMIATLALTVVWTLFPVQMRPALTLVQALGIREEDGITTQNQNSLNLHNTSLHMPKGKAYVKIHKVSSSLRAPHPPLTLSPHLPSEQQLNISQHTNCKTAHCEEFLSKADKVRQKNCLAETIKHKNLNPKEFLPENSCNFMDGRKRAPVALASAEGSGNTWIRGLLEKGSGFCTGFNFCDYIMRMKGFIGEGMNSGSVLVVKTHMKMPQWIGSKRKVSTAEARYGSGILLLRNPYYSLIAEWNRRLTNNVLIKQHQPHNESHVNVAPKEIWFSDSWDDFLQTYMTHWVERIQHWVLEQTSDHPVMVVRYEDLKRSTEREVRRVLSFLQLPFSIKDLTQRLKEDFTTFKRPHCETCNFERYTASQTLHMKSSLEHAIHLAEQSNMSHILKLDEYLKDLP